MGTRRILVTAILAAVAGVVGTSAIVTAPAAVAGGFGLDSAHVATGDRTAVDVEAAATGAQVTGVAMAPSQLDVDGDAERAALFAARGASCPEALPDRGYNRAPGLRYDGGIEGTTTGDLVDFARAFNAVRVDHCLDPVPAENFVFDECMEQRLVWIAGDPSDDPSSAWGHLGTVRSDGVPSVGCDGNLAGGTDNDGETLATKWWDSVDHRVSLYRPSVIVPGAGICIAFASVHGGVPNDGVGFTRAAARWLDCPA